MKPFPKITSENFKALLFFSRCLAFLSVLLIAIAIGLAIWEVFDSGLQSAARALPIITTSIFMYLFAGFVAALISIEESIRLQNVRSVSRREI